MEGRVIESHRLRYVTNELGDIYGRRYDDGTVETVEPNEEFGWSRWRKWENRPENRRSVDQIETLPDFSVTVEHGWRQFVPGPRPRRSQPWLKWKDGAAPPAAAESKDGARMFTDRLTEALGRVAARLPGAPERSPFVVYDFVGGCRIIVQYHPPPLEPGGAGTVYVLDDGHAFKIGYTNGYVDKRVAGLQTGNPRPIRTVARVRSASVEVEKRLRTEFGKWSLRGEWFERAPLEELATDAGGWDELLRRRLGPGNWHIDLNP